MPELPQQVEDTVTGKPRRRLGTIMHLPFTPGVSTEPQDHRAWDQKRKEKAWVRSAKGLKKSQKGQAKAEVVTPGPTVGPSIWTLICVYL